MKIPALHRPVDKALAGYESLLGQTRGPASAFPAEQILAAQWSVSASAVNRAAQRLIAAGRMRRTGYKLFPVASVAHTIAGARIAVLSHRSDRFPGIAAEAAARGVQIEELFNIGRDTLRANLRLAAERRFDAVIMSLSDSGWEWDHEAEEFDRLKIPYIVCDEVPVGHNVVAEDVRNGTAQVVAHLAEAGHRDIALLTSLRLVHRAAAVRQSYAEACGRLGLGPSADQVTEFSAHHRESVRAGLQEIRRNFPQATAVVLFDVDVLKFFLAAAQQERIAVSRDLSVVVVGDSPEARLARPPVTAAAFDSRVIGHLALDLACQQALEVRRAGRLAPPQRFRLEARLIVRASVNTLRENSERSAPAHPGRELRKWSSDRDTRLREAAETWKTPHRLAARHQPHEFAALDLSSFANRSLTREHGWLGDLPLLHLASGPQQVHGVPFQVMDERLNRGKAVVVLRSHRALASTATALPLELAVPVSRRVRAVYFLHGCGYAGESAAFAWYDFYRAGRRPVSLPIVPRGLRPTVGGALEPNIQDWWADFPQFSGPGVQHAVVSRDGDPIDYERYLYTLEWKNPEPGAKLESIYLRANPSLGTTLAVLAITVLLAE